MQDKFYYGLICGALAGVILDTINLTLYYFDIVNLRYLDWMAIMTYGNKPYNALDGGFALILQIGFCGTLGVIFTYLLPLIGFGHHIIKGVVFGLSVFQTSYFITTLFKVPGLTHIPPYTVMANFLSSSIFGAVLAVSVKQLVYEKV